MDINFSKFAISFADSALVQAFVPAPNQPGPQVVQNIPKPAPVPANIQNNGVDERKCSCNLL